MIEYYMIEATLATGATKYLIVRDTDGALTVFEQYDDKKVALEVLEFITRR
jgi:hypothetical protein